jgi:hypothetical protein
VGSGVVVVIVVLILRGVSRLVVSNRKTTGEVVSGRWPTRDAHGARRPAYGRADGHARWERTMRGVEASLDKVLALRLCDEGLELGGGEGVYETSLRDNEEKDLCTREG